MLQTPHIFISEIPWPHSQPTPKTDEEADQTPDPIGNIIDLFPPDGELPVRLTPESIQAVETAINMVSPAAEQTHGAFEPARNRQEIMDFLRSHQGKGAFPLFY